MREKIRLESVRFEVGNDDDDDDDGRTSLIEGRDRTSLEHEQRMCARDWSSIARVIVGPRPASVTCPLTDKLRPADSTITRAPFANLLRLCAFIVSRMGDFVFLSMLQRDESDS